MDWVEIAYYSLVCAWPQGGSFCILSIRNAPGGHPPYIHSNLGGT